MDYYSWMDSEYFNNQDEYLDDSSWCICNTNLPSLYRLLLHYSYIYTDCEKCSSSRYYYKYRRHVYEYDDEDKCKSKLENEDSEEIKIQIKNIIKKNPKILFKKVNNFTPLEFIDKLDNILDVEDTHPFLKCREHGKIRANQHSLYKIKQYANFEYLKYQIVKTVAFKYIKQSNHIGIDATRLQLPNEIWDYISTFV